LQREIFPQRTNDFGQGWLTTFDLAFYPKDKGPYNFETSPTRINTNGQLINRQQAWGGIMRNIDQIDFETSNIEYIEFWLQNPYILNTNSTGGKLYINLGNISEDVLKDGKRQVDDNGYYVVSTTTSNVIGNVNPDWIGGVYNTFKYKDFTLGFLVDVRQGGNVWSLDMFYAQYTGVLKESAGLNDLGNPVRNALADGGGVILDGVDKDGKVNTKRVVIDANSPANPQSNYSYDASYVKLREANLSYSLPSSIFAKVKGVKGIDVSYSEGIYGSSIKTCLMLILKKPSVQETCRDTRGELIRP
jgi:hypothetical protein